MFHTVLGPGQIPRRHRSVFRAPRWRGGDMRRLRTGIGRRQRSRSVAFKIWYSQAGTPHVKARLEHDAQSRTATLHLEQNVPPTPGQALKKPMPIPLRTALIGKQTGTEVAPERLILLDEPQQSITFDNVDEPPLLSINRDFSAPIMLHAERRPGELEQPCPIRHRPVRPLRGDAGADAARAGRRRARRAGGSRARRRGQSVRRCSPTRWTPPSRARRSCFRAKA